MYRISSPVRRIPILGIDFPITISNRSLWFQAAQCVANWIPRADALAAVTTSTAKILGPEGRVGQFAKGADGHVVLFSGDPLSITSVVEHVVLDGTHIYDRSKDVRVQQLIDGTRPPGTAAEDPDQEEWPGDGDGPDEGSGDGDDKSKDDKQD